MPQIGKTSGTQPKSSPRQRQIINGASRQSQLGDVSSSSHSEDFPLSKDSAFCSGVPNDSHEISGAHRFLCHLCVSAEDEDDLDGPCRWPDVTECGLSLSDLRGCCKIVPMFLQQLSVAGIAQVQHLGMVASTAFGPQVQRASVEIAAWNKECLLAHGRYENGRMMVNVDPAETTGTVLAGFERIDSSAVEA